MEADAVKIRRTVEDTEAEVELCRQAFKNFDKYETGTIPKTVSGGF
jgi:Ca2+-binding EF-hand superfamily protein